MSFGYAKESHVESTWVEATKSWGTFKQTTWLLFVKNPFPLIQFLRSCFPACLPEQLSKVGTRFLASVQYMGCLGRKSNQSSHPDGFGLEPSPKRPREKKRRAQGVPSSGFRNAIPNTKREPEKWGAVAESLTQRRPGIGTQRREPKGSPAKRFATSKSSAAMPRAFWWPGFGNCLPSFGSNKQGQLKKRVPLLGVVNNRTT